MTMMVQATTDEVPELGELVKQRQAQGLDRFDEYWEAVYRIVPAPSREHGRVTVELAMLLHPRVAQAGLEIATRINIGVDKQDARVPDIGVVRPDTEMTSPAFHTTAELVVEILSPQETPGEKLPFYAAWNVKEYLEVNLEPGSCRILRNDAGTWRPVATSSLIDLDVGEVEAVLSR